jgi:hypothetical protein
VESREQNLKNLSRHVEAGFSHINFLLSGAILDVLVEKNFRSLLIFLSTSFSSSPLRDILLTVRQLWSLEGFMYAVTRSELAAKLFKARQKLVSFTPAARTVFN